MIALVIKWKKTHKLQDGDDSVASSSQKPGLIPVTQAGLPLWVDRCRPAECTPPVFPGHSSTLTMDAMPKVNTSRPSSIRLTPRKKLFGNKSEYT
jgi:hypothetical protein